MDLLSGVLGGLVSGFLLGLGFFYSTKKFKTELFASLDGLSGNFTKIFTTAQKLKNSKKSLETHASNMENLSSKLERTADMGISRAEDSHKDIDRIDEEIEVLTKKFEHFDQSLKVFENILASFLDRNKRSIEMSHKLGSIDDQLQAIGTITFQTKILSFNAAIEAQRSDEKTRHGFNVVAKEIKKLADNTEKASWSISESFLEAKEFFELFQSDDKEGISRLTQNIETITSELSQAEKSLNKLLEKKQKMFDLASKMKEMSEDVHGVSEELNRVSNQNVELATGLSNQINDLQQNVEDMNGDIADIGGKLTGSIVENIDSQKAFSSLATFSEVIDVRGKAEFNDELGHIDRAKLVTIDDHFTEKMTEFQVNSSSPFLFVCRSGGRSARAAKLAQQLGFKKVYNLEGGMLAWNSEALPTVLDTKDAYDQST